MTDPLTAGEKKEMLKTESPMETESECGEGLARIMEALVKLWSPSTVGRTDQALWLEM